MKCIKNVAEFSVQKRTNGLPRQNHLFIILVGSASQSALQASESWEEGVGEWRESGKSRCLQAEKIQNFIEAFCSGKLAFQQNKCLPFILN